jgi:hypothetical protein
MTKDRRRSFSTLANQQGAAALLTATFAFLLRNNISKKLIMDSARQQLGRRKLAGGVRQYRRLVRAYEDMGMIMSAWFSLPRFLDQEGRPLPLTMNSGPHSISNLARLSRVKISPPLVIELMRRSPSVRIDSNGKFVAIKRVFVLPDIEILRAALVIERYLDTLRKNSSAHRSSATLLLERNCHVPEIDLKRIAPILRDIKGRGTAFMDSVDGDIEAHRNRKDGKKGVGELGVLVFAWTRRSKVRRSESSSRPTFELKR